jgi:hypothetical protein
MATHWGDERTPFQMGAWVSFYELSRVRLDMSSPATTRGFGRQAVKQPPAKREIKELREVQHPVITIVPASRIVWRPILGD